MVEDLENGLRKLGLDDKQAKVYLAALELGPSPVQKIAQRAGIPRATTYLVLDDLKNLGLVTTFDKGKKTQFVAESPNQLETLLEKNQTTLEEQKKMVKILIPELLVRGQFSITEKAIVRYYEGFAGLKSYLRDIFAGQGNELLGIFSHDDAEALMEKAKLSWEVIASKRHSQKISRRVIYTWREKKPDVQKIHGAKGLRYIPYIDFPCAVDIMIKGNKVGLMPYSEPIRAITIDDEAIATTMKLLFENTWQRAKNVK